MPRHLQSMVCEDCDVRWRGAESVCWVCGLPGAACHPVVMAGGAIYRQETDNEAYPESVA